MDYEQAEREFQRIEALRQAGSIDEEAYRIQLDALRVIDEHGRTWMLQERTGQWFVYDQGQWMASTPPGSETAPQPVQSPISPPSATEEPSRKAEPASSNRRPGCFSITLRIMLWMVVWLGTAWAVSALPRLTPRWAYWAVGVGALATLVLWVRWMTRHGRAQRSRAQGGAA